ncbi:hypothetical protein ACFRI7_38270 [Streptomyces sp. NPDC056716]|uniref:terpene synthase family protein n=1 Tax=unclassified Streptomyces TaxID=2593676 RepID=UPI0036BEC262
MITQVNTAIRIDPTPSTLDPRHLFRCPYPSQISPTAEQARQHTLDWLTNQHIINSTRQRSYVDAMRLDLYAARCAPQLDDEKLELFCDWIIYTTQLDDHVDSDDPAAIDATIRHLVAILDHDDPDQAQSDKDVFVVAFGDLWRRCQVIDQPWRRQLADRWAQWLEAYLTEASWRRDKLWPSLARYREIVRITSAALPFPLLSDHLSGLYLPDRILNSSPITTMRALIPDHTMAVNDVFSAPREALTNDHLNAVFIIQHEYGCTRDEAVQAVVASADDALRHFQYLEACLPALCRDLPATPTEQADTLRMASNLKHWFSGNLAWHQHDTARYANGIQPLGTASTDHR